MNIVRLTKTIIICTMVLAGIVTVSACSSKKATPSKTTAPTEATAAITTAPTATPTPSITEISGTILANDVAVTWTETTIDAKTMYVVLDSGYLKIRKGPGVEYDPPVGTLSDGMAVTVTATVVVADITWYRLSDGFYVCGTYLSDTQ